MGQGMMIQVFLLSSQVVKVSAWSHVIKPIFIMLTGVYIPECYQSLPHIGLLGLPSIAYTVCITRSF